MPFVLIFLGILFLVIAYRGSQQQLYTLIKGDFTGSGNFIYWIVSILVIGAIGYIPKLKGFSNAFLALVIIVLFLSNKGFFAQFNAQLKSGTSGTPVASSPSTPTVNSTTPTTTVTGTPLANVTGGLSLSSTPFGE